MEEGLDGEKMYGRKGLRERERERERWREGGWLEGGRGASREGIEHDPPFPSISVCRMDFPKSC